MKAIRLVALVAAAGCGLVAAEKPVSARAELIDTKGKPAGTATLTETRAGVLIRLNITGLTPGEHGFHIHETGRCEPPDFKSAGGHFNPGKREHGFHNPKGHHPGDLSNLIADSDGKAHLEVLAPHVPLGSGPQSLFRGPGTAIVVHAKPDDYSTDPAGNAGDRLVCGVIRKM